MDIREKMRQEIKDAGASKMTRSAYDTAWVARLGQLDRPLSNQALNWLAENQLPDGSWGASKPFYYHDRIICTLAAMAALTLQGRRSQDRRQIERGQHALDLLSQKATRGLMADPAGTTIGFEMIMPTLLAELESHNIIPHQDSDNILGRLTRQRRIKLSKFPAETINRQVNMAFYAEMVGPHELSLLDVQNLQEKNGSVAYSPAATAFFILHIHEDAAALAFLNEVAINGGVSDKAPIDTFEYAWILWNATLTGQLDDETLSLCKQPINELKRFWNNQPKEEAAVQGLDTAGGLSLRDGDTTAMVYQVLAQLDEKVDPQGLLRYEEEHGFRRFDLEVASSMITNIHTLAALRQMGLEIQHPSIQKILRFLKQSQIHHSFWFDKWHASPYYSTCHAIIACAGYADELIGTAVDWILNTQNEDGSWGF